MRVVKEVGNSRNKVGCRQHRCFGRVGEGKTVWLKQCEGSCGQKDCHTQKKGKKKLALGEQRIINSSRLNSKSLGDESRNSLKTAFY